MHWKPSHSKLLLAMSMDPREIGTRIKAAREAKGWTQVDFAAHANVSPSTVARWESGKLPPVRELVRVAGVLEVEPEKFVERPASETEAFSERLDRLEEQGEGTRQLLELVATAMGVEVPAA